MSSSSENGDTTLSYLLGNIITKSQTLNMLSQNLLHIYLRKFQDFYTTRTLGCLSFHRRISKKFIQISSS